MNNSIEQVGMPRGGDVLVREQMLSEVGERMFDGRGGVDVMAQLREQEAQQRVTALRSAVLRGYDEEFKGDARFFSEYEYLNSERARSDSKGFNMLLGGELSRVLANGNTYGVLRGVVAGLPKEQQQGAMERMRACKTEQEGKELLGELWGNGIKREWKMLKEQHAKQRAEQEEQLAQLRETLEAQQKNAQDLVGNALEDFWVYSVLDGEADLPERALYWWDDAGYGEEALEELRATHRRAANAMDTLFQTQYGMSRRALRAWVKEEAARREATWRKRGHFSLSGELEVPSDEVFKREALESASENFDVSREAIAKINNLLKDEDGALDERAVVLFAQALKKEAELMHGVRDGFWDNYFGRLLEWGDETGDFVRRAWGSDEMYHAEVEKLKGMLAIAEESRLAPGEGASGFNAVMTRLGGAAGGTTPMMAASMVPYVGKYLKYAANAPMLINEHVAENYLEGKASPKLEAWIQGSFESAAEALSMSALRKLPLSGKLMDWVGMKTVSVPLIGKAVGKVQGNAFLRVSTGMGMEIAGEMVVEDLVAETGTFLTVEGLRKLGVDFDEREWEPFKGAWQQMQDPAQAGATAAFCAALGMLGIPANIRAARDFAANRDVLLKAGLSERGIAEVSREHTKFRKESADKVEAERERLQQVRQEAEQKAVAEAENKAGRPLSYAEVADLRQEAGDAAVQQEVDKMADVLQEPLNKTMRVAYERDVLLQDPLEVKKRMEARKAEVLKDVEVALYAESGVRDYAFEQSGMLVSKQKDEEGRYTVSLPKGEQMMELKWTEEQLNAFVATQHKSAQVRLMRELQSRLAGTAVAEAAAQQGADGVKGMLVNMRALPKRAIARMERTGGRMNYSVLQDLAADARECVEGFVEGGMSVAEATRQESVVPGVSLGTLMQSATAFLHRVESMIGSEEGNQLGIQKVDDASTAVIRLDATAPGQSVLLYNKGLATEREIVEDLIERDVVAAAEGDGAVTSLAALKAMLLHVEDELVKHGGKRFVPNGKAAGRQDIIEGFARLAQSNFLLKHSQYDMSEAAHNTIEYVQKKLADTQHLVALSRAWDAFANSEEGKAYIAKEGATLEKLLTEAGASVAGHYAAAKFNAEALYAVKEAYEASFRSLEAARELMEEYEAEQKALDHPAEEAVVQVVAAEDSVTGEELRIEPEAAVDDETGDFVVPAGAEVVADAADKGRGLVGGNYVPMEDGSVYGVALVEDVQLSADVPQFKKKESAAGRVEADEDGTTHELAGGWNANSAPIHVWRRLDGRLEVISGRHRLAHAKKNGVKHIAVRVYDEADGHDAKWAKLHDVEQNILDNTCNAIDVAYYFRHNPMPLGEAEARGLMPKTRQGEQTAASRMGLYVAEKASDDTFTMLVNGQCSAEEAYMACLISETADGQQLALQTRMGKNGKKASWEYVTALVRGAQQMRPADGGGMLDLFGNDESFRAAAEKQAKYVAAVRAGLKARLNVLTSAGRLNKKGAVSKEMGVKVKTPKDLNNLVARIAQLDAAYERLDYELGIPARAEAWDGKSAVPTKLEELEGKGGSFSVRGMEPEMERVANAFHEVERAAAVEVSLAGLVGDSKVSFSVIGQNAATWDKYADRAFKGRDDGMLRAEIDASGAKIRWEDLRGKNVAAYRKLVEGWENLPEEVRSKVEAYAEMAYDYQDEGKALNKVAEEDFLEQYKKVIKLRDELKPKREEMRSLLNKLMVEHGGGAAAVLNMKGSELDELAMSLWGPYVESKVEDVLDMRPLWNGGMRLGDVLDYAELYEAYPELADIVVRYARMDDAAGRAVYGDGEREILININLEGEWEKIYSILLHEIQHHIQDIEGFAKGGNPAYARRLIIKRASMGDVGAMAMREFSDSELYNRLAGEIEAHNVQARYGWDMDRRNAIPFNSTLEYPGEALVTFSISPTLKVDIARARRRGIQPDGSFVPGIEMGRNEEIELCTMPDVLRFLHEPSVPMVARVFTLRKLLTDHNLTDEKTYEVVEKMNDPVMVLRENAAKYIMLLDLDAENKDGNLSPVVSVIEHKQGRDGNRYLVSAYPLDDTKMGKITQQLKKLVYCKYNDAAKFTADAPKGRAFELLRAAIDGGYTSGVADFKALVKYKLQSGLSFSIRGRDMLTEAPLGRMAAEEKLKRLMNYARKEAARFERTFSAGTPNARAAEAMGTISSIMGAIHKELPPKFRPRLDGQMRYMEVYARLLESGKVRAYGKLKKAERAAVEAELLEALREDKARVEEEYERATMEALDAAELTGHMDALEAAEGLDVADEVKKRAYLERLAKRSAAEARKRLLADLEVKKRALEAELDALTRDFAAEKLARIAGRMLKEAADAVEAFLIDGELETVDYLLEVLAPRKLPNGKYDKGRMSADAYRQFVKFTEMMDMSADEVAMRMQELGQQIAAEEGRSDAERGDDGEKLDQLTDELAALSTYGGLRGRKNLEVVRKGVAALERFAANERNAWSGVLKLQRDRAKRQARICAEALGGATSQAISDNEEKATKTLNQLASLGSAMQSIGQVFYSMGSVPELRVLADESLDEVAKGHVQLTLREKRAYEQLAQYLESIGLKTEKQRNDWMAALKKKHDTGIFLEGEWKTHTLKLKPLEAAEWLEMSKAEREKKREAMLEEAKKQKTDAENVVYEEDVPLLRAKYEEHLKKPGGRKWITTRRDFQLPAPKESLKISKDEALNILLLCEYGDYLDAAHANGYTDDVLEKLGHFVGSDVLGYGYAMRAILEGNGVAEVYEAREGVPFPKVKNYWPGGSFDQSSRSKEVDPLDPTVGNGTRYGMLITRVKHRLKFKYLGASNVFMAALAQQNNYIVMGELTAKWRRLLSHNDFAMALNKHLGKAGFTKFKELINLLDGAGVMESITQQTLSNVMSKMQSAHAMAVLAGALTTLAKQLSALTNAAAWEGGSVSRILYHVVRDRFGGGAIKYGDMMRKDYFQARNKDNRYFTEMLSLPRDANWSRFSKWARTGMGWIEKMDVMTNCFSMTALYNITYADLKKANKGAADPLTEAEIHAACDRAVRNALELGAQPLRRTQKSAWAALNNNALVKITSYMGTETINKIGMTLALGKRTGGAKGFWQGWWYLARVSAVQQCIVVILDMLRNANPEDDDEFTKWLLLNVATGVSGLGVLQAMPILGEVLEEFSGGYVKTGSLGDMLFDFTGAWRRVTDAWRLSTFDITEDVKAKRTSEHDFYVISYKKFNGTVVERKTDVPKNGGMYKGEYLSKDNAEAKALEVGKEMALEDAPGVDDWFMCGANLLRFSAAFTGAGGGINSSSKVVSELSGALQSLNTVANVLRPFMKHSIYAEQHEDARMKAEKKRKQEEKKAKREAEKEKKKRRSEMLNRG